MAALDPGETLVKEPERRKTSELIQLSTSVAVANDVVSKATVPPKSMLPVMGACACAVLQTSSAPHITAKMDAILLRLCFIWVVTVIVPDP